MKNTVIFLAKGFSIFCVFAYFAILAYLYVRQADMIYMPDPVQTIPDGFEEKGYKQITVETEDSEKLVGWYKAPKQNGYVVIFFHGNGGALRGNWEYLNYVSNLTDGLLAIDYRGFGGSTGYPSVEGLNQDALAAFDYLIRQGISEDRIIIMGHSLGTGPAVYLASQKKAAALILLAGYSSILDIVQHRFPFYPSRYLLHENIDSMTYISSIRMPLFMMHGMQDTIIPYRFGRKLFEAAPEPKQMISPEHESHVFIFNPAAMKPMEDYIDALKSVEK